MIYVVKNNTILNRIDAWITDGMEQMKKWIAANGYTLVDIEITTMGDMIMNIQ